jgi:hypothetical protein
MYGGIAQNANSTSIDVHDHVRAAAQRGLQELPAKALSNWKSNVQPERLVITQCQSRRAFACILRRNADGRSAKRSVKAS